MQQYLLKKMLVFTIILLFAGMVIIPSINSVNNTIRINNSSARIVAFNPFNEGWKYRKKVTIDHNKVAGNLVNFPVLVSTIDSDLRDKAQLDGDDILFMDDKGEAEQFFHEIEFYDGFSGELVAWVNIPSISSSSDTIFYMYYGNTTCSSQEFPEIVWDSDYIHVWHLGDGLEDSVGSDDGTNFGTSVVPGKVGKGRDFERNEGDYITLGDMLQPGDGSLTTITWEGWVKPESLNQGCFVVNKYNTQGADLRSYFILFYEDGTFRNRVFQANGVQTSSITNNAYAVIGQWTYLTSTFTLGGTNDIVPFIDGNEVFDTQPDNIGNYMWDISVSDDIGRYRPEDGTKYTDAVIDEIRWSKVVRSDDWIKTSYNSMNDPSSFLTFGKEEHPRISPHSRSIINILQNFLDTYPVLRFIITLYQK